MTDISTQTDWQKLIEVANRSDIENGGSATSHATDEEIEPLRQRAGQKGLAVDEDFVTFLRYANGIGFNGMTIPGADIDPGYHDFVTYNDKTSFIEIGPVYRNIDDTYYVLYPDGKFRSPGAGDEGCVLATYDTFFEMATAAIAEVGGPSVIESDNVGEIYASLSTTA